MALLVFLQEGADRKPWCQAVQVCLSIIINSYFTTSGTNIFFRCLVIIYADRGLVVSGKPAVNLLIKVFWFFWMAYFIIYVSSETVWVLQGTFFEMDHGKICLELPLPSYEKNNSNYPQLFVDIISIICFTYLATRLIYRTYRYITNVCPKKSMFSLENTGEIFQV